jgi:methylglyoxal synthase
MKNGSVFFNEADEDLADGPETPASGARWIAFAVDDNMLPHVKEFVKKFQHVFTKFKLVGPANALRAIQQALGVKNTRIGAWCSEARYGGLSQLATYVVQKQIGCIFTFPDGMLMTSQHVDDLAFHRLVNVHNVPHATNPATAEMMAHLLSRALDGNMELLPYLTQENPEMSPAVAEYNKNQAALVMRLSGQGQETATNGPALHASTDMQNRPAKNESVAKLPSLLSEEEMKDPSNMRCLALISHNHMKPAMQQFVKKNAKLLKKFRLTGTNSTMTMLRANLGEDANFGPTCSSGPLGGDAEVVAQLFEEDIGGVIFFTDPLDAHPHASDIEMTIKAVNLHNVMHAPNPATAEALCKILNQGFGDDGADLTLLKPFLVTLISPAVRGYQRSEWKAFVNTKLLYFLLVMVIILAVLIAVYNAWDYRNSE